MSDVASICSKFGIAVVPPARSRKEARLWKLARLRRCKDCCPTGVSHTCGTFFHRLLTAQGMNGRTAPVIQAVSDVLLAHPAWFGEDWLDALDKIDLFALHESVKVNRKAVQPAL
jgi:hypothetical protein